MIPLVRFVRPATMRQRSKAGAAQQCCAATKPGFAIFAQALPAGPRADPARSESPHGKKNARCVAGLPQSYANPAAILPFAAWCER
jgi:hypothetical protein